MRTITTQKGNQVFNARQLVEVSLSNCRPEDSIVWQIRARFTIVNNISSDGTFLLGEYTIKEDAEKVLDDLSTWLSKSVETYDKNYHFNYYSLPEKYVLDLI